MKASLWILRLSSRDSNCNCCSSEVTLVLQEYEESIHLAAVLTYKVLHGDAPRYLGPLTSVVDLPSRRALRSAVTNRLVVPSVRLSTVGS